MPESSGRLSGRGCLIVGGTGGIGLATALRFLDEGARVVVSGRSPDECDEARRQLDRPGFEAVAADVTEESAVDSLLAATLSVLDGRLDVLFHVAGISGRRFGDGPLDACTRAGWESVLATNLTGAFLTNRAAVRQMRTQPIDASGLRGSVLNLGSVLAESPAPEHFGTIAYAASKGALRSLTLSAASAYARERIRFNLMAPSLIATPMSARAMGDPSIRAYLAAKQPLAGGPGTPEDCAEAALFLCAPASRFITGAILNLDGGWSVCEKYHDE